MRLGARLLLVVALVAGVAGGAAGQDTTGAKPRKVRHSSDVITKEQLQATKYQNAYDIVEALHNTWLTPRSASTRMTTAQAAAGLSPTDTTAAAQMLRMRAQAPTPPLGQYEGVRVYQDGVQLGGVQDLKAIHVTLIQEIHHYSGNEAQTRYGLGNAAGVIEVTTMSGMAPR